MDFRECYLRLATHQALLRQTDHYQLHEPYLRRQRRSILRPLLIWVGRRLEQTGKTLQDRYSNVPHMAS